MIGEDREGCLLKIPLGRLEPPRVRVRQDAAPEEIRRLADSIRKHGLLQPLLVRPAGRRFEVVCGARRFAACRALGLRAVPALVRSLDDRQAFELSLAENARREPLTAAERRDILRRLQEIFPTRPLEELETWLGPHDVEAVAAAAPSKTEGTLPDLMERIEMTGAPQEAAPAAAAVAAPPAEGPAEIEPPVDIPLESVLEETRARQGLMPDIRTLLKRFGDTGEMDAPLQERIVQELFTMMERQSLPDFLDLRYREKPSRYLLRHCLNVAKLAMYLARSMGLPPKEIEQLAVCGLLHDVGMMRVKDEVFAKRSQLDAAAWKLVRGHPVEGALLLTKEAVLGDVVARVVLEHRPQADESGSPEGGYGGKIHRYAQLINVVDTYEAVVSPRAYRLPSLPYQAMQIVLDDGAKGMLDWELVYAFVKAMAIYPIGSYVKLETGEVARVIRANADNPERPVLSVVADARRTVLRKPVEIDLNVVRPVPHVEAIPAPI